MRTIRTKDFLQASYSCLSVHRNRQPNRAKRHPVSDTDSPPRVRPAMIVPGQLLRYPNVASVDYQIAVDSDYGRCYAWRSGADVNRSAAAVCLPRFHISTARHPGNHDATESQRHRRSTIAVDRDTMVNMLSSFSVRIAPSGTGTMGQDYDQHHHNKALAAKPTW